MFDVKSYYTVKCNPDTIIVNYLGKLGVNFDCTTQGEIRVITEKLGFLTASFIFNGYTHIPSNFYYYMSS